MDRGRCVVNDAVDNSLKYVNRMHDSSTFPIWTPFFFDIFLPRRFFVLTL